MVCVLPPLAGACSLTPSERASLQQTSSLTRSRGPQAGPVWRCEALAETRAKPEFPDALGSVCLGLTPSFNPTWNLKYIKGKEREPGGTSGPGWPSWRPAPGRVFGSSASSARGGSLSGDLPCLRTAPFLWGLQAQPRLVWLPCLSGAFVTWTPHSPAAEGRRAFQLPRLQGAPSRCSRVPPTVLRAHVRWGTPLWGWLSARAPF